ncbi:MAG: hypothetical protein JO169_15175 [Solirubrobacterales bacterium]|nr:hypothetical protein [Solirubrobacterales bacterium]
MPLSPSSVPSAGGAPQLLTVPPIVYGGGGPTLSPGPPLLLAGGSADPVGAVGSTSLPVAGGRAPLAGSSAAGSAPAGAVAQAASGAGSGLAAVGEPGALPSLATPILVKGPAPASAGQGGGFGGIALAALFGLSFLLATTMSRRRALLNSRPLLSAPPRWRSERPG